MAISTLSYLAVISTAFIVLCYAKSIAHVSGDLDAANNSVFCNGRWCVQNEEYCHKSQNKCRVCQYTQENCTQHLDCLSYCVGKGIHQTMQDRQDTILEENSHSAWALPLFILFLVLFIVSCSINIVFAVWFRRQRQRQATNQIETGPDTVTTENPEGTPLYDVLINNENTIPKVLYERVQVAV